MRKNFFRLAEPLPFVPASATMATGSATHGDHQREDTLARKSSLPWRRLLHTCDDGATSEALALNEALIGTGLPMESWFPDVDMSGCGGCLGYCATGVGDEPAGTPTSFFRRSWKRGLLGPGTLCVVGPNAGLNGPRDVLWSGTVMAAAYAASKGASAVAISSGLSELSGSPVKAAEWILEEQPAAPGLWLLDLTGTSSEISSEVPWDSCFVWQGRTTR